jgi:hypothetical protein
MRRVFNGNYVAEYSFAEQAFSAIDVHKESKKSGMLIQAPTGGTVIAHPQMVGQPEIPLDFNTWLPFAAPHYHISPDPSDYILVPVIVMPSDLPNRNSVAFPLRELVKFNTETGMQAYKTWKGKPTYLEHANNDVTKAYGVIADSFLRPLKGFSDGKIWKVMLLLAFDRQKHADVADKIASGEFNSYSMGAWVGGYSCSYCGAEVGTCSHIRKDQSRMYLLDGQLVFKNCHDILGFECSSVGTPAFISAISDTRMTLTQDGR